MDAIIPTMKSIPVSSESPYLLAAAGVFGTGWLYFGLNGMLRPLNALEVFAFPYPKDPKVQKLVDNLMILYGVRDLFMGLAVYLGVYLELRLVTGVLLILGGGVAFVDGVVNFNVIGTGQWSHWGYAPVVGVLGLVLVGVFD